MMKKLWWILPFVLVILVWFFFQYWLPSLLGLLDRKNELTAAGTFGDSYGALNTLFSGLAFAGIIISIVLQSQELKETRIELEGQKIQLERQAFENAFFQMLRLQNQIVESIRYYCPSMKKEFSGQQSFGKMNDDLQGLIETNSERLGKTAVEKYEYFYNQDVYWSLGHYFRNLYQIIKYVHNADIKNKKFYTNIVRAQLSSFELKLLFYNALSSYGFDKFRPLIVEYQMLEHLPTNKIKKDDALKFGVGAFGDSSEWKAFLASNSDR